MIKVYFESNSHAELVATFENESIYIACLPRLQIEAEKLNMVVTESIEETEKFARKCSITGEGMNQGWFSDEADKYFKYEKDALECCIEYDYKTIEKAYKNDFIYWTSWEDKDDYQYEMINDVLTEII